MKKVSMSVLALAAFVAAVGTAYATNHKATTHNGRVIYTYYAHRTGLSGTNFVWQQGLPTTSCGSVASIQASCTITTTVAPATIANYNNKYPSLQTPARSVSPAAPTNKAFAL
jgi:hypothetical protein